MSEEPYVPVSSNVKGWERLFIISYEGGVYT